MKRAIVILTAVFGASLLLSGCVTITADPPSPATTQAEPSPPASTSTPAPAPTVTPTPVDVPELNGCPPGFLADFNQAANDTSTFAPFFVEEMTKEDFFLSAAVASNGCFFTANEYGQSEDGHPNWVGFISGDFSVIQSIDTALTAGGFSYLFENSKALCSTLTGADGRQTFTLIANNEIPASQPQEIQDALSGYLQPPFVSIHAQDNSLGYGLPLIGACPAP